MGAVLQRQSGMKPLTFGVEIEFALATMPMSGVDPDPDDLRPLYIGTRGNNYDPRKYFRLIAETLTNAGVEAEFRVQGSYNGWKPKNEKAWSVLGDSSIMATNKRYEWERIELNSPVFEFNESSLVEIKSVCEILSAHYRMDFNRTCGLHIHVGNGYDGFSLQAIRNLMAILWTFEPQLEQIHPLYRQNNQQWCPSLRQSTYLAQQVNYSACQGLRQLLSNVKAFSDLRRMTSIPGRSSTRLAYHLGDPCAVFEQQADIKRTIEFRQHESTVDFEAIESWITLCVGVVKFAMVTRDGKLHSWLKECIDKSVEDYPLEQVLNHLDLNSLTPFFTKVIEDRKAGLDEKKCSEELFVIDKQRGVRATELAIRNELSG